MREQNQSSAILSQRQRRGSFLCLKVHCANEQMPGASFQGSWEKKQGWSGVKNGH